MFMPRESYERLRELWPEHADSRYQLVESDETFIDHDIFVAIRDAQTTFIKPLSARYRLVSWPCA